jgi:hypothetical protein
MKLISVHNFSLSIVAWLLCLLRQIISQSCANNCNNRGTCDKYSVCHCHAGFEGGDCSLRSCPQGIAWSDQPIGVDKAHHLAVCSGRGICDQTFGACSCMIGMLIRWLFKSLSLSSCFVGFTGSACERLDCGSSCSGNGRCLTLQNFAARTRNQNSQQFVYKNVWDAAKISGCHCDLGYSDYSCSTPLCPVGDDPLTKNQLNDIQYMRCLATAGNFLLYFKGYPSPWIPYSATALEVQTALLSISILTGITITFSNPTFPVCGTSSNIIKLNFTQQFGALPPLVSMIDSEMRASGGSVDIFANGDSVADDFANVYVSVPGTKEADSCANRGYCGGNGVCQCYNTNGDAYGSSNGYGQAGSLGECGYIQSGLTVSSCPGDIPCNNHGVCESGSFKCILDSITNQYVCPFGSAPCISGTCSLNTFRCACASDWTSGTNMHLFTL